ncbi:MAG: hypothetical protein JNJ54_30370 [Myxococcaceae bacterium]|nr:hypothetical protein [Myxococcaceae bacterium]
MKFPLVPVIVVVVFIVGFFTGRASAPTTAVAPAPSGPVGAAPMAMPPPSMPSASAQGAGLTGVVAEVLQVPNYTYLHLKTAVGDDWAAVATTNTVTTGQTVTVEVQTRMQSFTSKTLNRTFDSIAFGSLGAPGGPPGPVDEGAALPPGHPPMGAAPPSPAEVVARAIDATKLADALPMRVADVFSERQMLQGRAVRISGTVSKVTPIGGLHYAHLKDGSGSATDKTDDLFIISQQALQADAKVTLVGVVALDKDVGMGTKWPVVLENASLAK